MEIDRPLEKVVPVRRVLPHEILQVLLAWASLKWQRLHPLREPEIVAEIIATDAKREQVQLSPVARSFLRYASHRHSAVEVTINFSGGVDYPMIVLVKVHAQSLRDNLLNLESGVMLVDIRRSLFLRRLIAVWMIKIPLENLLLSDMRGAA